MIAVLITYLSAISSATTESLAEEFDLSLEVAQLSTAIFLFGVGPSRLTKSIYKASKLMLVHAIGSSHSAPCP
jgi:hypothetical protein